MKNYKSFARSHLEYRGNLNNEVFTNYFCERLKSIKYKAALSTTGAIWGRSREELYG